MSDAKLMYDASSDCVVGAMLGQKNGKILHLVHYASKILYEAQINYTITKKELLAVVFILFGWRKG